MHSVVTSYCAKRLYMCQIKSQHPHQLMIHVEDMETKKQHCSCIAA